MTGARRRRIKMISPADLAPLARMVQMPFDPRALAWAHGRAFRAPHPFLCKGLRAIAESCPDPDIAAIRRLFGLDRPGHSFTAEPHRWAWFHEPQITGGFCHFLTTGAPERQIARGKAFVKTAFRCAGKAPDAIDSLDIAGVCAFPELPVKCEGMHRRVDIAVELEAADGTIYGAAIEAKFGSGLRDGQLKAYRDHLHGERNWRDEQTVFLLVAPRAAVLDAAQPFDRNGWQSATWWRFLQTFEQELLTHDDDEEFRRFRRTVWSTSYPSPKG